MNISIIGTGYVGLVTGTCFSDMGIDVTCVDVDTRKIEKLNNGIVPIYEPGLSEIIERNVQAGRLHFVSDLAESIDNSDVVFIAVGTPMDADGSADLKYVLAAAKRFGELINKKTLIVTKSTVPVGTTHKVKEVVINELEKRGLDTSLVEVANNPEFLKEGAAIEDFMHPDRIAIGTESAFGRNLMSQLYSYLVEKGHTILFTDIKSSEMIKYASNAMLATRISFVNALSRYCEAIGANIEDVSLGMGMDSRIGPKFLKAGLGYFGSCFKKDVESLIAQFKSALGVPNPILCAVEAINDEQKMWPTVKLEKYLGSFYHKTIGFYGLAFKPETDDIRYSCAIDNAAVLLNEGAYLNIYDPVATDNYMDALHKMLKDKYEYTDEYIDELFDKRIAICNNAAEVSKNCDAVVLITEWDEFYNLNLQKIYDDLGEKKLFLDGRNVFTPEVMQSFGFKYYSIGR